MLILYTHIVNQTSRWANNVHLQRVVLRIESICVDEDVAGYLSTTLQYNRVLFDLDHLIVGQLDVLAAQRGTERETRSE